MELKLFADLIDALGKVAGGLKAIVNLPKAERETMRRTLDETYRLIDTTLNMVIIRLGDIQLQQSDDDLLREVARLENYDEWMQAERELRLCRSLRIALRETETLVGHLAGTVSTKDWDALLLQMQSILATEGEVALFIGQKFQQLANDARSVIQDMKQAPSIRDALADFRASLVAERQALIKQELELYEIV
ncbi:MULTISPECIES: hypothetical protein [Aphanothece]|uniref:hypothetical protein n=1 Tax=Aphanothece TaxID=1121 RepID=UPI003984A696